MKEGDTASFFVKDLGLALAPKMCPDQSQAFKEVNDSKAFPWEKKFSLHFFLNEPLPDAPSHACTKFRANFRRTDSVGPKLSQI